MPGSPDCDRLRHPCAAGSFQQLGARLWQAGTKTVGQALHPGLCTHVKLSQPSSFTQPVPSHAPACRAGTLGTIDSVSPASNAANDGAALDVVWAQASPDPAKEAVYSLQRYYTGDDSTGTAVCTNVAVTASELDRVSQTGTVTVGEVALPKLQLTGVPLCDLDKDPATTDKLAKGRCAHRMGAGRASLALYT